MRSVRREDKDLHDILTGAGLNSAAATALAGIPHQILDLDPKRPFRTAGSPRDEIMFVRSGILAKFKTDTSGRRQIVALRFAGEGILPSESSSNVGLQAITPTRVMVGKAEDLEPIIAVHPEIARFFLRMAQRENSINYEWLLSCGRRDSLSRVAHLLLEIARRTKAEPEKIGMINPFTQQEIADMTGQTSVNVNRMFAQLERQGLIRREGRRVFFEETQELRRVADFEETYLN